MKSRKPHEAAAQEALEEAGVKGSVRKEPIGQYVYWKRKSDHFVLCRVDVFPLEVSEQLPTWREKGQREARWFSPEDAAHHILEPDLASLILGLHGPSLEGAEPKGLASRKGLEPLTSGFGNPRPAHSHVRDLRPSKPLFS